MTREEAKAVLYEWQKSMVDHGVPIDTSKVQALRVAIEALSKPIVDITQRDLCADISCTDCPFMQETCKLMDYVAYAEAVQGWIPCSERLPNESGWYVISVVGFENITDVSYFYSDEAKWSDVSHTQSVVAWMPLPTPYKGGDEE